MKPHRILKDFPGSQHGTDFVRFREGEVADLSDSLAAIVVPLGWAEPDDETSEGADLAENRDTKVVTPEERKPQRNIRKK